MARKINWSGLKEYLFNHGEKIALGSCAFLALVLGLWGILQATGAGRADGTNKSYDEALREHKQRIESGMNSVQPDAAHVAKPLPVWGQFKSDFVGMPLINSREETADKRKKPTVLPIRSEPNNIRVDYIAALTWTYEAGINGQNRAFVYGLETGAPAEGGQPQPPPRLGGNQGAQPGAGTPPPPFLQAGRPERMIVVQAVFPMKDQVEEFRKKLNLSSQEDMFVKNRDDLPKPIGFDVYRFEVIDGKPSAKPVLLVGIDPEDGVFKVHPKLEKMLRDAMFDERSAEVLEKWIYAGLTMPMPKLANRKYPKFTFPGFDPQWAALEDEKNPEMMAGGGERGGNKGVVVNPLKLPGGREQPNEGGGVPKMAAPEYKIREIMVKEPHMLIDSYPTLVNRLFPGKDKRLDKDMNVFHVLGNFATMNKAVGPGGQGPGPNNVGNAERYFAAWDVGEPGMNGAGGGPGPGPRFGGEGGRGPIVGKQGGEGQPQATAFPKWDRDALVRFVDPSVEPGKTYFYTIRIRMANPNYGKAKEVAYEALAASPELPPSEWVTTPSRTIPDEYHLFAVDQPLFDDLAAGKVAKRTAIYNPNTYNHEVPFQIHQWIPKKRDNYIAVDYVIGDWVIAESQMVRKGEPIGKNLTVKAPVWVKEKNAFEVPQHKDPTIKKDPPRGIHLNMEQGGKAPILVDFTGGKRLTRQNGLEEEVAVDALILMPDGKLKVLNSRVASDLAERQDRVIAARHRIEEVQSNGAAPTTPGRPGPNLPGLPGFRPKGGGG